MTKFQFLAEMKKALDGNVPESVIKENEIYYLNYIDEQIKAGKREREVLEMLGDPILIAKTIIETQGGSGSYESEAVYEKQEQAAENGEDTSAYFSIAGHVMDFSKWYVRLLAVIITIIVVVLVLVVLVTLLRIALWLAVPILIFIAICILYQSFFKRS